jgi:hypothetical protein
MAQALDTWQCAKKSNPGEKRKNLKKNKINLFFLFFRLCCIIQAHFKGPVKSCHGVGVIAGPALQAHIFEGEQNGLGVYFGVSRKLVHTVNTLYNLAPDNSRFDTHFSQGHTSLVGSTQKDVCRG